MSLSSHGVHGVGLAQCFLHVFLIFLHAFLTAIVYFGGMQSSKAAPQSSLQIATSNKLLHGGERQLPGPQLEL